MRQEDTAMYTNCHRPPFGKKGKNDLSDYCSATDYSRAACVIH